MNPVESTKEEINLTEIRQKAISGYIWSFLERGSSYLVAFVFGLIQVRLLNPKDYGLIGMVTVFIMLSNVLVDNGFSVALIQKQNPKNKEFSSVFIVNVLLGLIIYCILFFAAPYISEFYNEPALIAIIRVVCLSIIFTALGLIQNTIIIKNLNFKKYAKINVTSSFVAGVSGVTLAYSGYGVWALVLQLVIQTGINTAILWISAPWSYGFRISGECLKGLFRLGSRLSVINIINSVYNELNNTLIGKFYRAESLGYYTRARITKDLVASEFSVAMSKVTLPTFSNLQDNNDAILAGMKKVLLMTGMINFTLLMYLCANARPVFIILFTEKWLASVPYYQLLCLTGLLMPITFIQLQLLLAKNLPNVYMKAELTNRIIQTIAIIFTISISIKALIIGQAVISVFYWIISGTLVHKYLGFTLLGQFLTFLPYLIIAGIIYLMNLLILSFIGTLDPFIIIAITFPVTLLFVILTGKIAKLTAYKDIIEIIKGYTGFKGIVKYL